MHFYNDTEPSACAWLRQLMAEGLIPQGVVCERPIQELDPEEIRGFVQCHFFAGIGGWARALALAGWPADEPVWTGSCPCQPFSTAGKRKGGKDERHLWPAFLRLVRECRPGTVFGEQVAGAAGYDWLARVSADLESEDYRVGAADLPAASVGAPHIRQRLFWVADAERDGGRFDQQEREQEGRTADGRVGAGTGTARRVADTGRAELRDARQPLGGEAGGVQAESAERQRVRPDTGHGGDTGGVGNAQSDGLDQQPGGCGVEDGKGQQCGSESAHDGGTGRLGSPSRPGQQGWQAGAEDGGDGSVCGEAGSAGPAGRGADCGLEHSAEFGCGGGSRQQRRQRTAQSEQGGFWADSVLIPCRDGKARRIPRPQSGVLGLADGLSNLLAALRDAGCPEEEIAAALTRFPLARSGPGRVGLLRGYGNAIVPELAAVFIRAFLEAEHADQEVQ